MRSSSRFAPSFVPLLALLALLGLAPAEAQPVARVRGAIECAVPDGGATFIAQLPDLRIFHRGAGGRSITSSATRSATSPTAT